MIPRRFRGHVDDFSFLVEPGLQLNIFDETWQVKNHELPQNAENS